MLLYALACLVVALIAAVLGFPAVAGAATWVAQTLALLFLVAFVAALVAGRRPPPA